MKRVLGAMLGIFSLAACAPKAATVVPPTTHHAPQPAIPSAINSDTSGYLTGVIVEILESENYTYLEVQTESEKIWLAGPRCDVKKNDVVKYPEGMPLRGYESKPLKRKFDVVYFVGAFVSGDQVCDSSTEIRRRKKEAEKNR